MADISTVAVLGAGTMGRGIAHVAALAGYATHLYDPFPEALKRMVAEILERPTQTLRLGGVVSAALGVVIVWLVRG